MSESTQGQGISTEVKGEFSPSQQEEVTLLAGQVMQSRGLDTKNPDHLDEVRAFVDDTLNRGLDLQGRVWFRPSESIAGAFDTGLSQREQVMKQLKELPTKGQYISQKEKNSLTHFINETSVFTPDLSLQEELIRKTTNRENEIKKFQKFVFENPGTAADVERLTAVADGWENLPGKETEIVNALYRNLLVHTALYRTPGFMIEPKDIAALAGVWDSQERMEKGKNEIVSQLEDLAEKSGFDKEAVGVYTEVMFESILGRIEDEQIDFEVLKNSTDFIFTPGVLRVEEEEHKGHIDNKNIIVVSEADLASSREKYREMARLNDEFAKSPEDQDIVDRYLAAWKELSSLDMVFFYKEYDEKRDMVDSFKTDLDEFSTPQETLGALKYVYAQDIQIGGTGSFFSDDSALQEQVREQISENVKHKLAGDLIDLKEVAEGLPEEFLLEVATDMTLTMNQAGALIALPADTWIHLFQRSGATIDEIESEDFLKNIKNNVDSEKLMPFLNRMSSKKQKEIVEGIRSIIQV